MAIYCVYHASTAVTPGAIAGSVPTTAEWTTDKAFVSLAAVIAGVILAAGDTIFVAHDHSYGYGAAQNIYPDVTSGFVWVLSIDRTNTTTATLLAGGTEFTNGNFGLNVGGKGFYYGMTFTAGNGGAAASAILGVTGATSSDTYPVLDKCTLRINGTSATYIKITDVANVQGFFNIKNCTFQFGASSQHLRIQSNQAFLENCTLAGTTVTALFSNTISKGAVNASGCDFSTPTNLIDVGADDVSSVYKFSNCKVPSSITTGAHPGVGASIVELHACSSSDHIYDYYHQDALGIIQDSQTIYLTTSPSQTKDVDGTLVSFSFELNPSTSVSKAFPLYGPWSAIFNAATGAKTVSMKVAYDNAAALKDTECWIEVEYYGDATTPKSTIEGSFPVVSGTISRDILAAGTNLTDTSEAWTGTGGWANKKTHTLSKTVTFNQQGYVRARVVVAADVTVYADGKVRVA